MKLSAIHHVAIIVSDIQAAKEIYVDKLGFTVVRENYLDERNDWKLDLRIGDGAEAIESAEACQPSGGMRAASSCISCGGCGGDGCRTGRARDSMRARTTG